MPKKNRHTFLPESLHEFSLSGLMERMKDRVSGEGDITVDQMLRLFGVRGFGFLLFVLSVLNIAIFFVPGLSFLFGLPMVVFAVQMLLGIQRPVLPVFLRHRTIDKSKLHRGLEVGRAAVMKIEPFIKPRFLFLVEGRVEKIHHFLALFLAMMVAVPVPFFNIPPSLALVCLSLGIMQRDGSFIIGSYAIAIWSFFLYRSLSHLAFTSL